MVCSHPKDVTLDARGEECPVPLQMAVERLEAMSPGEILRVRATDPASPIDIEAWCMREPHEYLGAEERDGVWNIRVRKVVGAVFSRDGRG